jgi:hypothetical protein
VRQAKRNLELEAAKAEAARLGEAHKELTVGGLELSEFVWIVPAMRPRIAPHARQLRSAASRSSWPAVRSLNPNVAAGSKVAMSRRRHDGLSYHTSQAVAGAAWWLLRMALCRENTCG